MLAGAACADEQARRLGAELAILAGDARRLVHDSSLGPREREGLVLRLRGALASLPLSLRRAGADAGPVSSLRAAIADSDWRGFLALSLQLSQRHPFSADFLKRPVTPQSIAQGAALHRAVCAPCHDVDWGDVPLPAKRLTVQARSMPLPEFAARLWLGVRGTREQAYANPFTAEELASLLAYYTQSRQ